MEKFTVDLDKVLDEFEFNEEQAIRHALQHFKREDLPATKYQKPHFKPINIADADFGPCIETTMTYPLYHHNYSEDTTDSPVEPDPLPVNCINPTLSDLISSSEVNSCHKETDTTHSQCNSREEISVTLHEESESKIQQIEGGEFENDGHKETSISNSEAEEKPLKAVKEEIGTAETKEKLLEVVGEALVEEESPSDSGNKLELIETESKIIEKKEEATEEEEEESRVETKLPEAAESIHEKTILHEPVTVGCLDLNKNDTESKSDEKFEVLETQFPTSNSDVGAPIEEPVICKTEVQPIQFESQLDITDEELAKYLEELEEEQEEERRRKESELRPSRPGTLDLKKGEEGKAPGSPGLTPLPRDPEVEEEAESEEGNLTNEGKEGYGEVTDNMEVADELERVLEDSRSFEPPLTIGERRLGKVSPFWIPDHLASSCMECDSKFTVIKRRHHCRACGRILCSKCCGMRASLEYLQNQEQRVCETCFRTLAKVMMYELQNESEGESSPKRRPNPNNPMEYCSTVPPPLQVASANGQPPPSVLVPVGVLKREGSSKVKETQKQVMFSDGIRPGGDLTELDGSGDQRNAFRRPGRTSKRAGTPPGNGSLIPSTLLPSIDSVSQSFIVEKCLPPICIMNKGETTYEENWPLSKVMERLKDPSAPPLQFAINKNLVVSVKIVKLDCCMKETCWVIVSKGMGCVGQDEIIVLLTLNGEKDDQIPKEIFLQFHYIYQEASRGNTVNELGSWCVKESSFLDSKQHGGFLFIRPTFQCLNRIETPSPPFLVGILIHRSEIPWARVFPFRLMLRLGAEFRYYPCPLVSVRFREPVYYEIGHTIINLLADFRNLSYTIPSVRGLKILMEANQTSILIPRNRYDQVIRALNNSNDPVLALAGNFSPEADAHLVCMQSKGNEVTYSTHAININDKPRKVTGASFVVLNGALKTTSGVAAKSSIVEDGLMVQVPSETMMTLRTKLRNMEDWSVRCGPTEGRNTDEIVKIIWPFGQANYYFATSDLRTFPQLALTLSRSNGEMSPSSAAKFDSLEPRGNCTVYYGARGRPSVKIRPNYMPIMQVKSVIDNRALDGMPSIRVHSGKDFMGCSKLIRWTQVFIIKCEDGATSAKIGDPLEVNKLSENIARATCIALTKFLELLAASGLTVLAVRASIEQDDVGYEAGSNGEKLAPIYMNSLDNELIPVLHKAASLNDSIAVLELVFHIMDQ